jgi:hypothetical protein
MKSVDWYYVPVILLGVVSFLSGYRNWGWWMNNPRARQMVRLLGGSQRARQFYMVVGVAFTITGVVGLLLSL